MLDASREGFGPSFGRGSAEARLRGKEGICRWFLARYDPLVEEGRVRRWYMSATEIESGKQEEERVRKENVRMLNILGGIQLRFGACLLD